MLHCAVLCYVVCSVVLCRAVGCGPTKFPILLLMHWHQVARSSPLALHAGHPHSPSLTSPSLIACLRAQRAAEAAAAEARLAFEQLLQAVQPGCNIRLQHTACA